MFLQIPPPVPMAWNVIVRMRYPGAFCEKNGAEWGIVPRLKRQEKPAGPTCSEIHPKRARADGGFFVVFRTGWASGGWS